MRTIKLSFPAFALVLVLSIISLNVKSQTNNALFFYGTRNYINLNRSIQDDFTIEFWMNTKQVGNYSSMWYGGNGIVDAEYPGVTNDFGVTLVGSKIAFGVGNPDYTIFSTSDVNTGQWVHVAATRNATSGLMELYINGVLESSYMHVNHNSLNVPNYIYLGKDNSGAFYNGALDEVRLWNTVRTSQEINNNMSSELNGTPGGLVNYFTFDEGVASGNNATVTTLNDYIGTNSQPLLNFNLTGSFSNWVSGFGTSILFPITYVWTGNNSNDWNDAGNWDNGVPQTAFATIEIDGGLTNYPILNTNIQIDNYTFNFNGGSLDLNGYAFTINGGTFNASGGIFITNNGSLAYINSCSLSNGLGDLDQSSPNGYTLLDLIISGNMHVGFNWNTQSVNIAHKISLTNGATLNTYYQNNFTLLSTSSYTASVDNLSNGNISGFVNVQRFIPQGHRAFRDLSGGGVWSGQPFFYSWQLGGNNVSGQGIYITGEKGTAVGYDNSTGFDYTSTGNPSLYTYFNSTWTAAGSNNTYVQNTMNSSIDPFIGYRVSVRGDRNIPNFGFSTDPISMNSSTVISNLGNLIQGDVVYTTSGIQNNTYNSGYGLTDGAGAFSFIANPYPSAIDWNLIGQTPTSAGTGTNISPSYYYFDPTLFTGGYATYVTYNSYAGTNSNSGSNVSNYIQPGASFFILNTGSNPSLTISENQKAADYSNASIFGTHKVVNKLGVKLSKSLEGNDTNIDGAVAVFDNKFTKAISIEDSKKMINGGENLSITEGSEDLSINGLPVPALNDVIALKLTQLVANTTYQLKVDVSNFSTSGLDAYIHDSETNTDVLATIGTTFTACNNSYASRFNIVFKAAKVLIATTIKSTSVYPNPVIGNNFNLQLNNLEKGVYNVTVYNNMAQQVLSTTVNHAGGNSNKAIAIKSLPVGVYTLKVSGNGEKYISEMIVK